MPDTLITGYAARGQGQILEPFEYAPPLLGANDVRVAVTHCGVCHTDIQAIDDYYGITTYPFVPGHEIVGYVTEMGEAVTGLNLGDRVGIGWQGRSCGTCEWCRKGETQLCMKIEDTTVMVPYGGFSSSVIADYRFVYLIPTAMTSANAAVMMCAGLTVYSAMQRYLLEPGTPVAILGVGGLGHLAIQFAHAMGWYVTAISSSPDKETRALSWGADRFVLSSDTAAMRALSYTQDIVFCTSNNGIRWGLIMTAIKKRGRLVLLGFPDLEFNSTNLVAHELSIAGSLIGTPGLMRAMLVFAREHAITPMVETMPMAQVNQALHIVRENKARYRVVLVNE